MRVLQSVRGLNWAQPTAFIISALARRGRFKRQLAIAFTSSAVVGAFMVLGAGAQYPSTIADTATAWLFNGRETGVGPNNQPIPDICVAPPPVKTHAAEPPPAVDDEAAASETPSEAPAPPPAPGLLPDGRPTPEALAIIDGLPPGADVTVATGWILYQLAHPGSGGFPDYPAFYDAYIQTALQLSKKATATDVVATMDPGADYSPYLLLAQAGAYKMMKQGSLKASELQRKELIDALVMTCAGPAGTGKARHTPTTTTEVEEPAQAPIQP